MGCGASAKKGEGSPSLNQYFKELKEYTANEIKDLNELAALTADGKTDEVKTKSTEITAKQEAFKKVRDRLLKDSFDHHDVSSDGILSKEESSKVFDHLTEESRGHDAALAKAEERRLLAVDLYMSKRMAGDAKADSAQVKEYAKMSQEETKAAIANIEKQMQDALADYRANKAKRDEVAFLVLDKTRDGRIQKVEFLAAFDPENEVHGTFMAALGLVINKDGTKDEPSLDK